MEYNKPVFVSPFSSYFFFFFEAESVLSVLSGYLPQREQFS